MVMRTPLITTLPPLPASVVSIFKARISPTAPTKVVVPLELTVKDLALVPPSVSTVSLKRTLLVPASITASFNKLTGPL